MATAAKILVIDDDEDFRMSLRTFLEKEGYVVIEADSGRSGCDRLIEHKPDVIILDIMMETLEEGYGVTASIRFQERYEEFQSVPIIMVSSIRWCRMARCRTPERRSASPGGNGDLMGRDGSVAPSRSS